jgi:hypothetical protein
MGKCAQVYFRQLDLRFEVEQIVLECFTIYRKDRSGLSFVFLNLIAMTSRINNLLL